MHLAYKYSTEQTNVQEKSACGQRLKRDPLMPYLKVDTLTMSECQLSAF